MPIKLSIKNLCMEYSYLLNEFKSKVGWRVKVIDIMWLFKFVDFDINVVIESQISTYLKNVISVSYDVHYFTVLFCFILCVIFYFIITTY